MIIGFNNDTAKKLIYFQLFFVLIMESLISIFRFPTTIRYITDAVNLLLFFCTYKKYNYVIKKTKLKPLIIVIVLFTIEIVSSSLLNLTSPITFIWAVRNTFRMFILFFSCVVALDIDDVDNILKKFLIMFWINAALCLYQFALLGKRQDFLGGIFGIEQGCNNYMNLFLCIMVAYVLIWFSCKKLSLSIMSLVLLVSFAIAALAEMKFFFIEFVVIIIMINLFLKFTFRKFIGIFGSVLAIYIGLLLLENFFPDQYIYVTDLNSFLEYAFGFENDASYMKIGRLSAFSQIDNWFFKDSLFYKIFGMGFGHCEKSNFELFNSEFYYKYGDTDYRAFVHSMLYLETGYLGLILFSLFFIVIIALIMSNMKSVKYYRNYMTLTAVSVVISLINLVYNTTMRSEPGFIMYFMLSISFIIFKVSKKDVANRGGGAK